MEQAQDVRTADQDRWLGGHLWACLHFAPQDKPGIPAWDCSITPTKKRRKQVAVKCGRCNGVGSIACFSLRYSGKCFACDGAGFRLISQAAYEKRRAAIAKAQGE